MVTVTQLAAETLLHAGHEHPNALWLAATAVLSFAAGVGVGAYGNVGRSFRDRFGTED